MNPTFSILTRQVDALLERALGDSSRAQDLCRGLAGRRLLVRVTGSPWSGSFVSSGTAMRCEILPAAAMTEPAADAAISGSAAALLALSGPDWQRLLQQGTVCIEGDAEIAQRFAELLQLLRPDVEQQIARLTGPIPAHLLWRGARAAWERGRGLLRNNVRNATDHLAYERRTLVPVAEAEHRFREIEAAREQLDRLEARLQHLEQRP